VKGDANRLKQVLINLIDNAYKFTPHSGEIMVETSIRGESAALIVSDTGCGIHSDDLPHVMEKFFKGTKSKAGSGLGLAICKEIIELHGGTMTVDSKHDKGTSVTIVLPSVKRTPYLST
jgi:signal transduction histidine kinase